MSPARGTEVAADSRERRSSRRYPVGMDLRYRLSRGRTVLKEGSGKTRDFSEGGVFFHTHQPAGSLPEGLDVELWLDWPAQINGQAVITVAIFGYTVRTAGNGIGVRISRCDFRASAPRPIPRA